MKNLKVFAVAAMMLAALVSCKKNDSPAEPEPKPPVELDNAIEYNGTVTEIKSRFVDMETGVIYLVSREGVTSAGQLDGVNDEYVSILPGDDVESDTNVYEMDFAAVPAGFEMRYVKDGETVLDISETSYDIVSEGSLTVTMIVEEGAETVTGIIEFSMTLSGDVEFRGNASVVLDMSDEPSLYPENDMTFVVDGEESAVGTAAVEDFEGYVMFTVTPEPDAGLFNDIYDGGYDYIQLLILPEFLNQDMDVLTESAVIYGYRGSDQTELSITPGSGRELLDSGYVRIDHEDGTEEYVLYMSLNFTGGPSVGVNATGMMTGDTPQEGSTITVNGDTQPVRASFYLDMDGFVYLYFTSADIEYFGEIEDAVGYFGLVLSEDDLTGNEFDITATDKYFYLFYVDNMTGEMPEATSDDDPLEASGTVSVERSASDPEQFVARITVAFGDGTEVSLDFDGACLSVDYVPEEPNEFTYMGVTESIQSVLVDKSGGALWEIWVSAAPGLDTVADFEDDGAIHITAPEEAFNCGAGVGFSTFKDTMKFEYDGRTWQYQEDGSVMGTLEVSLEGDQITLDFTTYGDLSGHFAGTATVVE